ncbi:MAG: hypothetical protein M0Q44_09035 [Methylobacter sp.]|nr:hypothetical protein [Methylobacter sp.]
MRKNEENRPLVGIQSRMPRRVPELSLATPGESEERRKQAATGNRQPGRLFFGYFLLATQKKVTRFRVREPDSNNRRGSDTFLQQIKTA